MAASGDAKNNSELRIFASLDDLATDLAEYVAQLSEMSVKERGFFTIALTGGSLIYLMRYFYEQRKFVISISVLLRIEVSE